MGPPGADVVASSCSSLQLEHQAVLLWVGWCSFLCVRVSGWDRAGTGVAATAWAGTEPLTLLSPQRALLAMLGGVRAAL